jgi:hypothetical protein
LLVRSWGDPSYGDALITEPVGQIDGVDSKFYWNGVLQDPSTYQYTGQPGLSYVTFNSPPPDGTTVTCDVPLYFFWVRFKDDSLDFEKFSGPPGAAYWMIKKITLVSVRGEAPPPPAPAPPAPPPPPPPPGPPPPAPPQNGWQVCVTFGPGGWANPSGNPAFWGLTAVDATLPYVDANGHTQTSFGAAIVGEAPALSNPMFVCQDFIETFELFQINGISAAAFYHLSFGAITGDLSTGQGEVGTACFVIYQTPFTGNTSFVPFMAWTNTSVTITPYPPS